MPRKLQTIKYDLNFTQSFAPSPTIITDLFIYYSKLTIIFFYSGFYLANTLVLSTSFNSSSPITDSSKSMTLFSENI